MIPVLISWSGGKDSALALYEISSKNKYEIKAIFTTISEEYKRISMHGVRKELLIRQTISLGYPVHIIELPKNVSDEIYSEMMKREMLKFKLSNVNDVVFGDIFLEDVRQYRENNLKKVGMNAIFPLWGKSSKEVAKRFLDLGFKAIITCVDSTFLDKSFVGQLFNDTFLSLLPPKVDPCGENGEFHTFVFDGPNFSNPISFKKKEIILRENRFYFIDLI